MTKEQHAAYMRILASDNGRFAMSEAPDIPGTAFSGGLTGADAAPAPTPDAIDREGAFPDPAPCDLCGRLTDCLPCEHCSFSGPIARALAVVLEPGRQGTDPERLAAFHALANDGSWHANETIKHRVYKAAAGVVGRDGAKAMFKPRPEGEDDWDSAFKDLDDIDVEEQLPPLARSLAWPYRLAVVHGPPGSGKTRVLAAAAAAVSSSAAWAGGPTGDEPKVVLWIALEDLGGAARLLKHHGAAGVAVKFGPGHSLIPDWPGRMAELCERYSPDWIILDSFAVLAAALGVDSNNADEVTVAMAPLLKAAAAGAAVTITHHEPRKEERTRNSTGIDANADILMRVTHLEDERITTIERQPKYRFGMEVEQTVLLKLSEDGKAFDRVDERENHYESRRQDIADAIANDSMLSIRGIADLLDLPQGGRWYGDLKALIEQERKHFNASQPRHAQ